LVAGAPLGERYFCGEQQKAEDGERDPQTTVMDADCVTA